MKIIITYLLLLLNSNASFVKPPQIEDVRSLYLQAAHEEKACRELLNMLTPYGPDKAPLLAGYKACSLMLMGKYVFNPLRKLSYFNNGKSLLEKAIKYQPGNTELRFLRFTVQSEAPAFLNYSDSLEADKRFLLKSIPGLNDLVLKKWISGHLLQSTLLSEQEKQMLIYE